jgi:hypothetical protein
MTWIASLLVQQVRAARRAREVIGASDNAPDPRERVKEVLQPLSLATAHRIVLKPYLSDPRLDFLRAASASAEGRS